MSSPVPRIRVRSVLFLSLSLSVSLFARSPLASEASVIFALRSVLPARHVAEDRSTKRYSRGTRADEAGGKRSLPRNIIIPLPCDSLVLRAWNSRACDTTRRSISVVMCRERRRKWRFRVVDAPDGLRTSRRSHSNSLGNSRTRSLFFFFFFFPFFLYLSFLPTRDISRMKLDSDRVRHFSDHSKIIPADDESDAANLPIEFRASNQTVRNARTIAEDEVQVESRCCY